MGKGLIGTHMHVNRGHVSLTPTYEIRKLYGQIKLWKLKGETDRINKALERIDHLKKSINNPEEKKIDYKKQYGMFGWKAEQVRSS